MEHHARDPAAADSGRGRPAAGGNSRSNGFDVSSMNSRKPTLMSPITPSTRATISSGRWRLLSATAIVHAAQHQHPQQHRAFVRAPGRGEPVLRAAAASWSWSRRSAPRSRWRRTTTRGSRRRTRRTGTAPARAAARAPSTTAMPRCAPTSGSVPEQRREQQREDQRELSELGNHRRVLRVMASASWRPCPSPRAIAPGRRRRRPRAACSSRRASPALRSRGTRRPGRSCPARRRPCPP